MNKFIVLLIAGLVFEIVFLLIKAEIKNVPLDIVIGTAISAASIPILIGFLLSPNIFVVMISLVINLMLLSLLIGIAGSIISFIIWYNLRITRFVLRFEYE